MNSSAKYIFTLVAAGTLGAVAFACTVSSGTVDDIDGGSNTSSGTSGTATGTSGGAVDAGATVCPSLDYRIDGQIATFDNTACDTCLRTNCCTETAGCWNMAENTPPGDGGTFGCEAFENFLSECDDKSDDQAAADECKTFTAAGATPGIPAAYNAYQQCRLTKCDTDCNHITDVSEPPDAGSK